MGVKWTHEYLIHIEYLSSYFPSQPLCLQHALLPLLQVPTVQDPNVLPRLQRKNRAQREAGRHT